MAVSPGDTITAADFNNLQSRIAQVLGTGSGDFGYGQAVSSSQVTSLTDPSIPDGDSVLASQFNDLRDDLGKAYKHQEGSDIPIASFTAGDIIGADESGTDLNFDQSGNYIFANEDTSKGFNDFLTIMTDLESNRFVIHPSQEEVQVRDSDQRTSSFNGTITSQFTVSFPNEDDRRHFFNSGGDIRFEGTVDLSTSQPGSGARDEGWNDLLENPGTVRFDYNSTTITGSTSGVSFPGGVIGNDALTGSFQVIYRKDANGGTYGDSFWTIEAREDSSTVLRFRITLVDDGPESNTDAGQPGSIEPGVTEPVTADIEFEYSARRANGEVVLPFPAFSIVDTFE